MCIKLPEIEDLKRAVHLDWNVTLGEKHKEYTVVRIDGCPHSTNGAGENCYYIYPRGEELTLDNIMKYNGDICWGFKAEQFNMNVSRGRVESRTICYITCAGKVVYEFMSDISTAANRIMVAIEKLKTHPLDIPMIDYEKKAVGRKVYYRDKPAIITRCHKDFVILEPDGEVENFGKLPFQTQQDYEDNYEGYVKEDILSDSIFWFR